MTAAEKLREYRKTPRGWAGMAWANICTRLKHDPDYNGVELRMTREEFVAWCEKAVDEWRAANPGKTASIDRIDDKDHYRIGNIRILEVGQNSRRRDFNKNSKAPAGKAWCSGHKGYIDIALFSPAPSRPPLFVNNRCRECKRREYRRSVGG